MFKKKKEDPVAVLIILRILPYERATPLPRPSFCHFLSPHRSLRTPVVFTTRLSGVLGCSTVNLDSVLAPGGHAALGHSATAGQAGHLAGRQDPVPKTKLGQLPNQRLGRVKASTDGILEEWSDREAVIQDKNTFDFHTQKGSPRLFRSLGQACEPATGPDGESWSKGVQYNAGQRGSPGPGWGPPRPLAAASEHYADAHLLHPTPQHHLAYLLTQNHLKCASIAVFSRILKAVPNTIYFGVSLTCILRCVQTKSVDIFF